MNCKRCGTRMRDDAAAGRQQAGNQTYIKITGYTCWNCGNWFKVQPEVTPVAEVIKQEHMGKRGGSPIGCKESRAKEVAFVYASKIAVWLETGLSWHSIGHELIRQSGVGFDYRALKRYYLQQSQGVA